MNMKNRDFQAILQHVYAVFVVLVAFWIYVKTLAPTVSFFDSGELISAAYTLGVAHPPGYPLYVLLGWLFSKLPIGDVAYRINLMSAVFGSLAVLMVYYITYSIIVRHGRNSELGTRNSELETRNSKPDPDRMLCPVVAMVAALTFAFSITHWKQGLIAEVYTLNAFLWGLIVWLLLKWYSYNFSKEHPPGPPQGGNYHSWLLYLIALIFGLGFGNHQTLALLSIAVCFLVVITTPRILLKGKTLLLILLSLMLGLTIYVLVPIRAAQHPPINWGNAVNLRQFRWLITREGYNNVPRGDALQTLWNDLVGKQSPPQADSGLTGKTSPAPPQGGTEPTPDPSQEGNVHPPGPSQEGNGHPSGPPQGGIEPTPAPSQEGNEEGIARIYHIIKHSLLLRQVSSFNPLREFGYIGLMFAFVGILYSLIVYRVIGVTFLIAVLSLLIFIVIIGDPPEENIFLLEEFHTPSYLLLAVWIGVGAMAIARAALWVASLDRRWQYGVVFVLAVFFLFPPGLQMWKHLKLVNRRQNYVAYDYASNILDSLKPNAILFTWGDSGAFPLWYLHIVEKRRPDVTLIHVPHLSTDWYVDQSPQDLFISEDPFHKYGGNIFPMIDEIVNKFSFSRPIYFDYSSAHSIIPPYELLPHGIVYKVAVPGDTLDEDVWNRYRFRGILDETRRYIALDPDVRRTFLMYGSARIELGQYYLDLGFLDKAASEFNAAVEFDPSLGDGIVRMLQFHDKLLGGQVPKSPDMMQNITVVPQLKTD